MKLSLSYWPPALAFLKALVGRRDPTESTSTFGVKKLHGWKHLPESTPWAKSRITRVQTRAGVWLYCFLGPHAGEIFQVQGPRSTVGTHALDSIVLTPASSPSGRYEFTLGDQVLLTGSAPQPFMLNGRPEYHAALVDYDEIELLGSHFIVLQMGAIKP